LLVWRELLVDGLVNNDVGSDTFWMQRYDFFEKELGVTKLEYYDKIIKELIKIEDLSNYKEVVLWFEFDLFCQVNLLALCSYLLKYYRKDITYYLICVGNDKGKEKLQTLADYAPENYKYLLENKVKLTRNDLLFADQCWEMYVRNNREELKQFNFDKNKKFTYLQLAMNQHLMRFSNTNRLNQINTKFLEIIDSASLNEKQIVRALLKWQRDNTVYGFGDLQYFGYLKKLNNFYEIVSDQYYLNKAGKNILKN